MLDDVTIISCNDPEIGRPRDKRASDPLGEGVQFRCREKVNIFYQGIELDVQVSLHLSLSKINTNLSRIMAFQYRMSDEIPLADRRTACTHDYCISSCDIKRPRLYGRIDIVNVCVDDGILVREDPSPHQVPRYLVEWFPAPVVVGVSHSFYLPGLSVLGYGALYTVTCLMHAPEKIKGVFIYSVFTGGHPSRCYHGKF